MITNTPQIGIKNFMNQKKRTFFALIGIILSVSLLVSIAILGNQMNHALQQEVYEQYADVDLMIGYRYNDKLLHTEQVKQITDQLEVVDFGGALVNPQKHVQSDKSLDFGDALFYGIENSSMLKSYYKLHQDLNANELILSDQLATRLGVDVHSTISIPTPNGKQDWKVAEVIQRPPLSKDILFFELNSLQKAYGLEGLYNLVLLDLREGTDKDQFAEDVKVQVSQDLDIDYLDGLNEAKENIQSMQIMGIALGILVILISSLFVLSTLQISLRSKIREFAIPRAIGFSRGKCFRISLIEALCLTTLGTMIGAGIGVLLPRLLSAPISEWLHVSSIKPEINISLIVILSLACWLYFMIIGCIPALASSRVLPIEAIRSVDDLEKQGANKSWVMWGFIILSVALFILSLFSTSNTLNIVLKVGMGISISLAVYTQIAVFTKWIMGLLTLPIRKFAGNHAYVSIKQLKEQSKRFSLSILLISISLALSFLVIGILFTIQTAMEKSIEEDYFSNLMIKSSRDMLSSVPVLIEQDLEQIDGINQFFSFSTAEYAEIIGDQNDMVEINYGLASLEKLSTKQLIRNFSTPVEHSTVINQALANRLQISIGNEITVVKQGKEVKLQIVDIIQKPPGNEDLSEEIYFILVDWSNALNRDGDSLLPIRKILVDVDETKLELVENGLSQLFKEYSELRWSTKEQALAGVKEQLAQRKMLLWTFLSVLILVGSLGILNSFHSMIHSKRREYAILRAIHITPKQLTMIITLQSLVITIVASLIGWITGVIITYSIVGSIGDSVQIPWTVQLILTFATMIFVVILMYPTAAKLGKRSIIGEIQTV